VALDFHGLGALADALGETIAREEVDVVNSNATRDRRALTWLRLRRRLSLPFVVTRHTMPLTLPPELIVVGLSADRTVAVSHAVARALRRRLHPGARLRVVPNGIDCERIDTPPSEAELAAARTALGDVAGRPIVLVLARRRKPGRHHFRDDRSARAAARPPRLGRCPCPRAWRPRVRATDRAGRPRSRAARVLSGAHRRADGSGVSRSGGAAARAWGGL